MRKNKTRSDILGIKPYADAITNAIDNFFKDNESEREGSFNVLISAQWGMGKTFILKKIGGKLEKRGFKTFLFNPWKYSQSPIAIKRKFLQNLHKEFGGRINLDSLYEGIEGEKHRSLVSEAVFIANGIFRMLIYTSIISLLIYLSLRIATALFLVSFNNFFYILFSFLKINADLKIQDYLLEIAIVIGFLGALVPALKFVFENVSIKTKRAEVDSLEQFEEIFSKIILQKRHATILSFVGVIRTFFTWFWKEVFMWDMFLLAPLDEWRLQIYKRVFKKIKELKKRLEAKIGKLLENHPHLKSMGVTTLLLAKWLKERLINKVQRSLKQDKYPKVAILIDDLDRCEEKEVKNILDGFLTFFENKNCAYIVTADHTVIEKHIKKQLELSQKQGISTQEAYSTPKEYLHKIFNLNFLVPSPPRNNLQTFLDNTANSFGLKNKNIADLAYNFFKRNPRAIKRFYTKIKFNQDVAQNLTKDPKAEEERKFVAQRVLDKPELKAKIIALEMATPNFFSLVVEDPQIAADGEAAKQVNKEKLYFGGTENIESRLQDEEEKNEINIADRILKSKPFIADETDISYEMLISFSSSTHSTIEDTFDWPQIQQDMEKGNPVFQKVYLGTTNKGRTLIRKKALERYKVLKGSNEETRHLFLQGMIEIAQASYRKKDDVVSWGVDILNELGSELEEYIAKIEPKDYAKLLEVFQEHPVKETETLLKVLAQEPFRKQPLAQVIFQASDLEPTKDEDGKLSSRTKDTIKYTSQAFSTVLVEQVGPNYHQLLSEIFIANYKAPDASIPLNNRINYLNSLISILAQKKDTEQLKQNLDFAKQQTDKALLAGITQESWGLTMSTLSDDDLINYLGDPELASPPTKANILKGIADQVSNWDITKTLTVLEHLKSTLTSLPQPREQLDEEQAPVLEIFLASISTQEAQKSTQIRKLISEVIPSFTTLLTVDEKNKVVSVYQTSVNTTRSIIQLEEIKAEAVKIGFSGIAKAVDQKINSIKKKQAQKKSRRSKKKKEQKS